MNLQKFQFSDEIITYFKEAKIIPLNFYNKSGQVLIHTKTKATANEVNGLLRFKQQGIYYDKDDEHKLKRRPRKYKTPEGLTGTRLLTEETSRALIASSHDLFRQLKSSGLTSLATQKLKKTLNDVFENFIKQPDVNTGLINILELLSHENLSYEIEISIKRTVVAMAMKTRGIIYQNAKERDKMQNQMNHLLCASMLCDISYSKMKIPDTGELTQEQMEYIRKHPLVSYLMLAHESTLDRKIKRNILVQHRPMPSDENTNNYPKLKWIILKLSEMYRTHGAHPEKKHIAQNIAGTIHDLNREILYDEDAAILSLASEFASLTTDVAWRPAYEPQKAIKLMINNSFFSTPLRMIREFLDNLAISLCNNRLILTEGDFLIIHADSMSGHDHMEVCRITNVDRYQSRPDVQRIGFIKPNVHRTPKLRLTGFDPKNVTLDKRQSEYYMKSDTSRRIVYVVDEELDPQLYEYLNGLTENNGLR